MDKNNYSFTSYYIGVNGDISYKTILLDEYRRDRRMTKEEKCIVTAYTGFLMVSIDTFRSWLKENNYTEPSGISDPILIPLGFEKLRAEVKDKFLELCDKETNND